MNIPTIKAVIFTSANKFYGILETNEPVKKIFCENSAKDLGVAMSYLRHRNSFLEIGFQSEFKVRVLAQNYIALGTVALSENNRTDFVTEFSEKKLKVIERSD